MFNTSNNSAEKYMRGFTIVELLIVIVVVGILASITVVAYNGMQTRARDSQRLLDANSIEKALQIYLIKYGELPAINPSTPAGGWETSNNTALPGGFLSALSSAGIASKVPVDPTNSTARHYRYHRYNSGSSGCDSSKGRFAIFQIVDMETSGRPHPKNPGFSCSTRNWSTEADYTFGIFENP